MAICDHRLRITSIMRRSAIGLSIAGLSTLLIAGRPPDQDSDGTNFDDPGGSTVAKDRPGLLERFEKLDRNGDGVLTADELKRPGVFKRLDQNNDGSVSLEEAKSYLRNRRQLKNKDRAENPQRLEALSSRSSGGTEDASNARRASGVPAASEQRLSAGRTSASEERNVGLANLRFTKDYFSGTRDRNGKLLGGTETNAIVAHEGQLYAAISYWNSETTATGPQILLKPAYNSSWQVDAELGDRYLRVAALRSILFKTDITGKRLNTPVRLLLAGTCWIGGGDEAVVFTKRGATGPWKRVVIARDAPLTAGRYPEVRVIFDHVDRVTGTHYVFAAVGNSMYRGVYDPQVPGEIRWEADAEMKWSSGGRILAAAEANGIAYVTVNISPQRPGVGGLFRRVDGQSPRWEQVYEWTWSHPNSEHLRPKYGMRGLTAVTGKDKREFLLGAREHPGVIERIDTSTGKPSLELDVRRLVEEHLMSGEKYMAVTLIAYNDMVPVADPDNGQRAHLIGLWINPKSAEPRMARSSWYLVRWENARYSLGRVFDPDHPDPISGLRGTRTICKSPFPEDRDRVLYFGGFDAARGPHLNTAWIYKAEIPKKNHRSGDEFQENPSSPVPAAAASR